MYINPVSIYFKYLLWRGPINLMNHRIQSPCTRYNLPYTLILNLRTDSTVGLCAKIEPMQINKEN